MWRSVTGYIFSRTERVSLWMRSHRKFVVFTSVILILALAIPPILFKNPNVAEAALTGIRQEINITTGSLSAASGAYATSSAIIQLDTARYTGATYYFEVVGSTTAATNATVSLVNAGTGVALTSVTMNGTSYDRYRSSSFSPTGSNDLTVRLNNESVGKGIIAARIIIIQNSDPISATQTQIEIGNEETYTANATSPLASPKYWNYDSNNWDGSPTFYAEVTYENVDAPSLVSYYSSTTVFTTAGSFTYTADTNATSTLVQLWGGGGAGAGDNGVNRQAGGGGAGGQYAASQVAVTGGANYTVVVAATQAGTNGSGAAGNDSTFNSTTVVAKGGAGGAAGANGAGGTGSTASCVGTTCFAGGNGANGTDNSNGGGGGGGAGTGGAGGNASGATAGSGTATGGGSGGTGPTSNDTDGAPGTQAGGGGSGGIGKNGGATSRIGGTGAAGRATLTEYMSSSAPVAATTTIVLQESDGTGDGFTGWTTKATIVSDGTATTPTRVRSGSFTPTNGRNYRIAVSNGYGGATFAVYNAKIIVDQTSPNKVEAQYLLANTDLFSGTGLQGYSTYYDDAEWGLSETTFIHQVDAADNSTSVVEVDTSGDVQVSGSVVSSPDNSAQSSSMTMPATGNIDTQATTNNGDVYASRILVRVTPDTTAPAPNPYFTALPSAVSSTTISMTSVTITDTNAVSYYFTPVTGDCGLDAGGNGTASGWQSSASYSDTTLSANKCYAYTVTGKDEVNNVTATSTASSTYTLAAAPGGPTYSSVGVTSFNISNTENGNSTSNPETDYVIYISSSDTNWNGFYLDDNGATSSSPVWLTDLQIDGDTLNNLQDNTLYEFESVARNADGILTATSTKTGVTTIQDTFAPTPNPTFTSPPDDVSNNQITMTSSIPSTEDTPPISYFFTVTGTGCGVDYGANGVDSGWQLSNSFTTATNLETNQCYGYTVTAKDAYDNTTATSSVSTAYTAANTPAAPTIDTVGTTTMDITINANGNPGTTTYAVRLSGASPADVTWEGKYLDTDGTPSDTAVWMTKATIDITTIEGLNEYTSYDVDVKARNGDGDETGFSATATDTTLDQSPPTPNPTFSSGPSNDSTVQISMTSNTVTDASGNGEWYYFTAVQGACSAAHYGSGGTSSGWQDGVNTYSDNGLQANYCYGYTVTAKDDFDNTTATSSASITYTSAAIPGQPSGTSITDYSFSVVNDANGNPDGAGGIPDTQYVVYFTSSHSGWNGVWLDTDGSSSTAPVWMTDSTIEAITVTGLLPSTTYTASVVARNEDGDLTATSTTGNIVTSADATAPTPNPYFTTAPTNDSATQISMTSVAVDDDTLPVNYYFTAVTGSCGANLGANADSSGWQAGLSYSDSGLEANQCYAYTVTAKDNNNNTTATSTASSTYTSANVPGLITSTAVGDDTITIQIDENGNPTANPDTEFAVFVTTADITWNNKYVDVNGDPQDTAQWLTNSQIDGLLVTGLSFATTYTFSAKARNVDLDETSFGSTNNLSTVDQIIPRTRIYGGVRLQGARLY